MAHENKKFESINRAFINYGGRFFVLYFNTNKVSFLAAKNVSLKDIQLKLWDIPETSEDIMTKIVKIVKHPKMAILYSHADDDVLSMIANMIMRKKVKPHLSIMLEGIPLKEVHKKKDLKGGLPWQVPNGGY